MKRKWFSPGEVPSHDCEPQLLHLGRLEEACSWINGPKKQNNLCNEHVNWGKWSFLRILQMCVCVRFPLADDGGIVYPNKSLL